MRRSRPKIARIPRGGAGKVKPQVVLVAKLKRATAMFKGGITNSTARANTYHSLKRDKRLGFNKIVSFRKIKTFKNDAGHNINLFEAKYE